MLSHEPKNYALLALRRRARPARRGVPLEPRRAVRRGVPAPRARAPARRRRRRRARRVPRRRHGAAPPRAADARRLVARAADARRRREYLGDSRDAGASSPYEALLASGRTTWTVGERVRVYRTRARRRRRWSSMPDDDGADRARADRARLRRRALRARAARHFRRAPRPRVHAGDFDAVFADPDQPSLFPPSFETMRSVLTTSRR